MRKHWENHHPGDVLVLIAEQLSRREKQDESMFESVSEFKDEELITMMELSSTDSAVDSRSAKCRWVFSIFLSGKWFNKNS